MEQQTVDGLIGEGHLIQVEGVYLAQQPILDFTDGIIAANVGSKTVVSADLAGTFDLRYLKLDQTSPQSVINNAPHFDEGIIIKTGKKLYLDGQ